MFESADHEPSWDRLHTAGAVMVTRRIRPRVRHAVRVAFGVIASVGFGVLLMLSLVGD